MLIGKLPTTRIFCKIILNSKVTGINIIDPDNTFWQKKWRSLEFHVQSTTPQFSLYSILNQLTLRVAKTGLAILEIFYLQRYFLGNIWRRNVDHKPNNNPPSNILWTFALFLSYFQKYERSSRSFSRGILNSWNGQAWCTTNCETLPMESLYSWVIFKSMREADDPFQEEFWIHGMGRLGARQIVKPCLWSRSSQVEMHVYKTVCWNVMM